MCRLHVEGRDSFGGIPKRGERKRDCRPCRLTEVVGVHVKDNGNLFRERGGGEDLLHVPGEGARVGRFKEELETEEAMRLGSGGRIGHSEFDAGGKVFGEALVEILQGELGQTFVTALAGEKGSVTEGGEIELATEIKFLVSESLVVVMARELNGGRMGSEGLDHHFALHLATPGTARHLGEQLKGALTSPEVGGMK